MLARRSVIVLLAGLNLLLLAVLLIGSYSLPAARAAGGARPGDFASVTAKARGQAYDVLYLLDRHEKKLHAFYPTSIQSKRYAYGQYRDLDKDFGN